MNTVGMDLGTQRVKAAVLKDYAVVSRRQAFSGLDPTKAAEEAVNEALKGANLKISDVVYFVATSSAIDKTVASVMEEHRKKIKYTCSSCKPESSDAPCVLACKPKAIKCTWNTH
jgi:Fe-S-cluster-containing hydrogenase component 2